MRNTFDGAGVDSSPPPAPQMSKEEAKAQRQAERSAQKLQNAAPKKIEKLEDRIAEAEAALAAIDADMVSAGADVGRLAELGEQRAALQAKADGWYVEMEELEAQRAKSAEMLERPKLIAVTDPRHKRGNPCQ